MTANRKEKTGHNKGMAAEALGALYLRLKGYRILARRYKTHLGEIDLIAMRYGVIAFVEVKLRRTHEDAAEAIHRINQSRVRRAAELYLAKHTQYTVFETRFDALVMAPRKLPQHIRNAF
ncbi:MAG TPA: YraN family protein [Patescibacteria group bacterium]|nr:YraN family protein [Patescibacteria group bacterium]